MNSQKDNSNYWTRWAENAARDTESHITEIDSETGEIIRRIPSNISATVYTGTPEFKQNLTDFDLVDPKGEAPVSASYSARFYDAPGASHAFAGGQKAAMQDKNQKTLEDFTEK